MSFVSSNSPENPDVLPEHVPVLDGLRGVAILLVLIDHLRLESIFTILKPLLEKLNPGHLGVDLFFVLSGFLITRILIREKRAKTPLRYFYYRRALRIFPIFYLVIFIMAVLMPGPPVIWSALYLSNFYFYFNPIFHPLGHTWTLAAEEQFYLLWPVLVRQVSRPALLVILGGTLFTGFFVCAILPLIITVPHGLNYFVIKGTFARMLSLGLGSYLALEEKNMQCKSSKIKRWAMCTALLYLLTLVPAFVSPLQFVEIRSLGILGISALSFAFMLAALRSQCFQSGLIFACLTYTPLQFLGKISYGLYLYHYIINYIIYDEELTLLGIPPHLLEVCLALLASLLVATLSYIYLESPILRFKSKWGGTKHVTPGLS